MSTRSTIARRLPDGTFEAIYCHNDGYPSYNGRILFEHYQDEAKIEALFGLGSLSVLGQEIGEYHSWEERRTNWEGEHIWDNWCLAYGRDRGEPNTEAQKYGSIEALRITLRTSWTEWFYVWSGGVWQFFAINHDPLHGQPELMMLTPEAWAPVKESVEEEE